MNTFAGMNYFLFVRLVLLLSTDFKYGIITGLCAIKGAMALNKSTDQ